MIRVEINAFKLDAQKHDVTIGTKLVKALKAAEIPVLANAFVIRGVERGRLTYWSEGDTQFVNWREGDSDDPKNPMQKTWSKDGVTIYKSGQHLEDDEL